jgi:hypothetical protein
MPEINSNILPLPKYFYKKYKRKIIVINLFGPINKTLMLKNIRVLFSLDI